MADAKVRYLAEFTPQAWINDYAVDVDPEGDTTWDCTAALEAQFAAAAAYGGPTPYGHWSTLYARQHVNDQIEQLGNFLDRDDVLRDDPEAPAWVRDWSGPFSIHVSYLEPPAEAE